MTTPSFNEILHHFGGVVALSRQLGISHSAVTLWRGRVPKVRAYHIAHLCRGRWTPEEIRAARPWRKPMFAEENAAMERALRLTGSPWGECES